MSTPWASTKPSSIRYTEDAVGAAAGLVCAGAPVEANSKIAAAMQPATNICRIFIVPPQACPSYCKNQAHSQRIAIESGLCLAASIRGNRLERQYVIMIAGSSETDGPPPVSEHAFQLVNRATRGYVGISGIHRKR